MRRGSRAEQQAAPMNHHKLRRRLSLALPALVFLSFSFAENIEIRAIADTLVSFGETDEQPAQVQPAYRSEDARKPCLPLPNRLREV
jgi:hypothetical protein